MSRKIVLEIWTCPKCENTCEWAKGSLFSVCKCGGWMVNTYQGREIESREDSDVKYVDFPGVPFGDSVSGVVEKDRNVRIK